MTDDLGRGGNGEKGDNGKDDSDKARRSATGSTGERRYGKPANGTHSFARPASRDGASAGGERRYGKPAHRDGTPAGATGDRKFGKPADGARSFARPARPAGASAGGDRRYGKPAHRDGASSGTTGDRKFGKPADGARSFARPARPAGDGARQYGKPADGARSFARPAHRDGAGATGDRRFAKPAGNTPRSFARPARPSGTAPRFARPAPARRVFSAPAAPTEETGLRLGARRLAFDILCDVHQNGAFAALSLNEHLRGKALSPEDRRLVTNIVYGTLENELQIDYALDKLMERPTNEPSQRDILRMSAYQILFLDRVPDSAAVNEGVKLCKIVGTESASGFINAVLRNLVRGKDDFVWPKREDDLRQYLSIMGSVPMWLVDRVIADYGAEEGERILMHRENAHPVVVRPNLFTSSDEQLEKLLTEKELRFERGQAPHAYLVHGSSELNLDPDYQKGLFSMQGQSSMLAAEAVQAKPGMKILDACAAPGGKSAYLCEQMQLTGRVYAWELHEKRAMLLEATKRRLHLENLRISVRDATEPKPDMEGTLDAVLLDAPCSGTGVIAQKPDVKLRITENDVTEIVKTQERLLNALCRLVKPRGTFVYSTCSILPDENERQIERFLAAHPEFVMDNLPLTYPEALRQRQTPLGLQLLGYRDGTEGFYIARMRRTR